MKIPKRTTQAIKDARRRLAKATGIDPIRRIWVEAEVFRLEARVAADHKLLRLAAELRLLAERKLGKLLAAMNLSGGDRRSPEFDRSAVSKLQALGVPKSQSSRWQRIASVPERRFQEYLRDAASEEKGPTSAGLLRLAKTLKEAKGGRAKRA